MGPLLAVGAAAPCLVWPDRPGRSVWPGWLFWPGWPVWPGVAVAPPPAAGFGAAAALGPPFGSGLLCTLGADRALRLRT
ncbi:hypothetical protein ACIBI0_34130 [Microbispora rosea]|uniref:hypothetical protein n=2 Tax=Microbispora rosea TaxID=58117 RepID=UPI003788C0C7